MKKIYKSPAIEAVEIETVGMISTSPGSNNTSVAPGGGTSIESGNEGQYGDYGAGRNRGFGNLWGNN